MSFGSAELPSSWRDVYLAASARAVSLGGDELAAVTLVLAVQSRGGGGWGVAALLIAAALPVAVLAPAAGRLADRVDSRRLLVITALAQAAVCAALAFVRAPLCMVGLVALLAVGVAVTQPTLGALVPSMVRGEDLPRAMSVWQTANAIGMLAGPALAGVLAGAFGSTLPLLLDAASYLGLAAAGWAIRTRRGGARSRPVGNHEPADARIPVGGGDVRSDSVRDDGRAPLILRQDPVLLALLISLAAVIGSVTVAGVAEVFFVRATLAASTTMYGLVTAAWTVGLLVGAWPFGRLRGDDVRLLRVALVALASLATVVLASSGVPSAVWLIPLYVGGGVLNAGLNVVIGTVLGRRVPPAVRGRVGGVFTAVGSGANLVGFLGGALLLQVGSPRGVIAVGAGVSLVVAMVCLLSTRPLAAARRAGWPVVSYRPET